MSGFDDGYVLCMNMNTEARGAREVYGAEVRYLAYVLQSSGYPDLPYVCSRQYGAGAYVLLTWTRGADADSTNNSLTYFAWVFELERGWSFDGYDFPAFDHQLVVLGRAV